MRIDNLKHPIIERLSTGLLGEVVPVEGLESFIIDNMDRYKDVFSQITSDQTPIYIITKPFLDVITRDDISKRMYSLRKDLPTTSGVAVLNNITLVYHVENHNEINATLFVFHGNVFKGFLQIEYAKEDEADGHFDIAIDKEYTFVMGNNYEELIGIMDMIIGFLMFKEYADVEEKLIIKKSGEKIFNCHYTNNTNRNIRIMDCTWFTTLIKSEGFNVRGHFRLQPCGEGMKDKKLIWINDFKKSGYTREAGINKINP
jgi:hypothetical protein